MISSDRIVLCTLLGSLFVVACGGSTPPAETTPPAESATAPEPLPATPAADAGAPAPAASAAPAASPPKLAAPPEIAWKDKTFDQRKEFMKDVVMPKMKTLFSDFDAKKFGDMTCVTCHGPAAKTGKFTMPNAKLPKLDPTDGFAKHKKAKPEITQFMLEKVEPQMASTLGVEPYNPDTKQGFGCFNCHTMHGK